MARFVQFADKRTGVHCAGKTARAPTTRDMPQRFWGEVLAEKRCTECTFRILRLDGGAQLRSR